MRMRFSLHRLVEILTVGVLVAGAPLVAVAQSGPAFSTQTPESGVLGTSFVILLPVVNSGAGSASKVSVTSASFGSAAVLGPVLPQLLGTEAKGGVFQLVLQFDSSHLILGARYLLTVRGTYQFGGATLGFAVNRFLGVTQPSSSVQTDLKRWVAFDAIRAEQASLPHLDQITDGQALLNFVMNRPEFVAVGHYPDYSSIWAVFADGLPLLISNDFYSISDTSATTGAISIAISSQRVTSSDLGAVLSVPSIVSPRKLSASLAANSSDPPTEIPESLSARVLNTLDQLADPRLVSDLSGWLLANGYTPDILAGTGVEDLKAVGGDGVFFFRTHGAFVSLAGSAVVYALWTSTVATYANFAEYLASNELEPTESPLVFFEALRADGVSELHYGITAKFIEKHWSSFSPNSFVYIDACDSNLSSDFVQEIFNEDASVYAGWPTNTGDPFAARTARLVFDRLLGANEFCPETDPSSVTPCVAGKATPPIFPQRPFDYTSIVGTEFTFHNVGQVSNVNSPYFGSALIFTSNPGSSSFGLLAPSISNMMVDESKGQEGQLTINGVFGTDPRLPPGSDNDGMVTVGGPSSKATIESWNPNQIVVDLELSGPLSGGDVQVTVRGHKSNLARLTEWKGNQFTYVFSENGSLQVKSTYNLHVRADIRQWRNQIHNPPIEPNTGFFSAKDSTGAATASGSATGPGVDESFSWSGSASLVDVFGASTSSAIVVLDGLIRDHTKMTMVALGATTGLPPQGTTCQVCTLFSCISSLVPPVGPSNSVSLASASGNINYFTFDLDKDTADILSNHAELNGLIPECNDSLPENGANGLFNWGPVSATQSTAPDPKSAR